MIQEGKKAPAFSGVDQNGTKVSLKDFKGQKVALYFYPKDDTPGCTAQACNLRDNYKTLTKAGIAIIGVSADTAAKHKKFETKYQLPFPLIADTERTIIEAYGVWGEKSMFGKKFMGIHRTTFLIDENGKILKVITKPNTEDHAAEVLEGFGL